MKRVSETLATESVRVGLTDAGRVFIELVDMPDGVADYTELWADDWDWTAATLLELHRNPPPKRPNKIDSVIGIGLAYEALEHGHVEIAIHGDGSVDLCSLPSAGEPEAYDGYEGSVVELHPAEFVAIAEALAELRTRHAGPAPAA